MTTRHPPLRFAAIGLDHRHVYDQVKSLRDIGAQCVGYWTRGDPIPLKGFVERFPDIARVDDYRRFLDDPSIQLIANETNRGFGAAINQAAKLTQAPLLWILNPDCRVLPGA